MSAEKLACDIQVYLGLNLIHSDKEKLQGLARDLERGGASARGAVLELKALINAQGSAMNREAGVNLMRGASSVADHGHIGGPLSPLVEALRNPPRRHGGPRPGRWTGRP